MLSVEPPMLEPQRTLDASRKAEAEIAGSLASDDLAQDRMGFEADALGEPNDALVLLDETHEIGLADLPDIHVLRALLNLVRQYRAVRVLRMCKMLTLT